MADRTRVRDADGIPYLEKDVGGGQFAMAVVTVDGAGNLTTGSGSGAVTIANGSDAAEGALADAAVVTNASGSVSAKLRGLVALARKGAASAPAAVAVDDTAGGTVLIALNAARLSVVFANVAGGKTIYIGKDATVTAANGIPVPAGTEFTDDRTTGAWKAICTTAETADVRVLEVS